MNTKESSRNASGEKLKYYYALLVLILTLLNSELVKAQETGTSPEILFAKWFDRFHVVYACLQNINGTEAFDIRLLSLEDGSILRMSEPVPTDIFSPIDYDATGSVLGTDENGLLIMDMLLGQYGLVFAGKIESAYFYWHGDEQYIVTQEENGPLTARNNQNEVSTISVAASWHSVVKKEGVLFLEDNKLFLWTPEGSQALVSQSLVPILEADKQGDLLSVVFEYGRVPTVLISFDLGKTWDLKGWGTFGTNIAVRMTSDGKATTALVSPEGMVGFSSLSPKLTEDGYIPFIAWTLPGTKQVSNLEWSEEDDFLLRTQRESLTIEMPLVEEVWEVDASEGC